MTCHLQQKTGAAIQTASTCYWDKATDGAPPAATLLSPSDRTRPHARFHTPGPRRAPRAGSASNDRTINHHTPVPPMRAPAGYCYNLWQSTAPDGMQALVTVYGAMV